MNLLRHLRLVPRYEVEPLADGALIHRIRGLRVEETIRLGPNHVHAAIIHPDGSVTDLGVSRNLLNTDGRDLVAAALGGVGINNGSNVATGATATSLSDTGEAWTTDIYKGWTVIAEETTNTPVWGNIGSNSATVLTIDSWHNGDDSAGTTPGATANYLILPTCRPRYMALTENAGAAAAGDTVLTGELTTGGCSRALCAYAHSNDAATFTLQKAFSVTATFPAIHKMGLFSAGTLTAAGILVFESVLNGDASVLSGDTLTVTDTCTLS